MRFSIPFISSDRESLIFGGAMPQKMQFSVAYVELKACMTDKAEDNHAMLPADD
jgi:hypothetical protein